MESGEWTGERKNQLVLIGRDLVPDQVRAEWQACLC